MGELIYIDESGRGWLATNAVAEGGHDSVSVFGTPMGGPYADAHDALHALTVFKQGGQQIDVENMPIPEGLGECVDLLKAVETRRLAMQHDTDDMKAYENKLEEHLINNVSKDSAGVFGKSYKAKITTKLKPTLKDSAVAFDWIAKNGRFDMLQKRLADKAVMDFHEQTKTFPPGMEGFNAVSVSLTKI